MGDQGMPKDPERKPEQMNKDAKDIADRMGDIVRKVQNEGTDELYNKLCVELLDAYIKNTTMIVPMRMKDSKVNYGTYRLDAARYAYRVYTISGNKFPSAGEMDAFMPWRKFIEYALSDEDADGIIINPLPIPFGHKAYLPRSVLQEIVRRAEVILNPPPDDAQRQASGEDSSNRSAQDLVEKAYRKVKDQIGAAMAAFFEQPSVQMVYKVLDAIIYGYMYNVLCYVAVSEDGITMKQFRNPENTGYVYVMFTAAEGMEKRNESVACMTYRDAIRKAADNKDIIGFYIDPKAGGPFAVMTRQNMEAVIRTGEEHIGRFTQEMKEMLKIYPDRPSLPGIRILRTEDN